MNPLELVTGYQQAVVVAAACATGVADAIAPGPPIHRGPRLEAPGPLGAPQAAQPHALPPDLDHQMVGGLADPGVDDLGQVDPE